MARNTAVSSSACQFLEQRVPICQHFLLLSKKLLPQVQLLPRQLGRWWRSIKRIRLSFRESNEAHAV